MKVGKGEPKLKTEDAELLKAFATMQGLDSAGLVQLAMAALVAQIRVQIPHCAHCPMMQTHQRPPLPDNVVLAKFS